MSEPDTPIDDHEAYSNWLHKHMAKKGRSAGQIESLMESGTGLLLFEVWEAAKDQSAIKVASLKQQLTAARERAVRWEAKTWIADEALEQRDQELTAARAEIELLKTNLKISFRQTEQAVQDRADEHKTLTEQRDRLAEALKELLRTGDNGYGTPTDSAWEMAEQALQSLTTNEQ